MCSRAWQLLLEQEVKAAACHHRCVSAGMGINVTISSGKSAQKSLKCATPVSVAAVVAQSAAGGSQFGSHHNTIEGNVD